MAHTSYNVHGHTDCMYIGMFCFVLFDLFVREVISTEACIHSSPVNLDHFLKERVTWAFINFPSNTMYIQAGIGMYYKKVHKIQIYGKLTHCKPLNVLYQATVK